MDDPWFIRPARIDDAPSLARIEAASFSDPWPPDGFRDVLEAPGFTAMVAESQAGILGYAIARSVGAVAEILDFAVDPQWRKQGVGHALLHAAVGALRGQHVGEIYLEVRESNHAAQALYRGFGFERVGSRPRYYRNPVENAILLRLIMDPAASDRSP